MSDNLRGSKPVASGLETSTRFVRSAAAAGWWTILIAAIWLLAGWVGYLWAMHARPDWMLTLWGAGPLTWLDVQTIYIWLFGAFKLVLFVGVLLTVWLTILARKLGRSPE